MLTLTSEPVTPLNRPVPPVTTNGVLVAGSPGREGGSSSCRSRSGRSRPGRPWQQRCRADDPRPPTSRRGADGSRRSRDRSTRTRHRRPEDSPWRVKTASPPRSRTSSSGSSRRNAAPVPSSPSMSLRRRRRLLTGRQQRTLPSGRHRAAEPLRSGRFAFMLSDRHLMTSIRSSRAASARPRTSVREAPAHRIGRKDGLWSAAPPRGGRRSRCSRGAGPRRRGPAPGRLRRSGSRPLAREALEHAGRPRQAGTRGAEQRDPRRRRSCSGRPSHHPAS